MTDDRPRGEIVFPSSSSRFLLRAPNPINVKRIQLPDSCFLPFVISMVLCASINTMTTDGDVHCVARERDRRNKINRGKGRERKKFLLIENNKN